MSPHRRPSAGLIPLTVAVLTPVLIARAQSSVDEYISERMAAGHTPGLAACLVNNDHVVWAKGYGWAQIEEQIPVTPDTLFKLASVSKTVTGTALMQLHDAGLFGLDDDINDYLPFPVRNPHHPMAPITFRQVLTHTSSIRDNWDVLGGLMEYGDPSVSLADFVEGYFAPWGVYYDPALNFHAAAPGEEWHYANLGFALCGYLVECISGQPFEDYCAASLFAPLGMSESSWYLADLDPDTLAMAYDYDPGSGSYVPYGYISYPDVPAGELHASVTELANFLIMHICEGSFGDVQVLSDGSARAMHTVQFPAVSTTQALAFYHMSLDGDGLIGHNGGDWGIRTGCYFRPEDGAGAIVLTNGDNYGLVTQVLTRLFDEADGVVGRARGDLNCDGAVDFFDIVHFVQALTDPAAYREYHDSDPAPMCDLMLADVNEDGAVDFFDIDPFVELVTQ